MDRLAAAADRADVFIASCKAPAVTVRVLAAKMLVIHAWLKAAARSGGDGRVPAIAGGGPAAVPAAAAAPAKAMLLTVAQVLCLDPAVQATPVPLPPAGGEAAAPLAVAGALVASVGLKQLAKALGSKLQELRAAGHGGATAGAAAKQQKGKGEQEGSGSSSKKGRKQKDKGSSSDGGAAAAAAASAADQAERGGKESKSSSKGGKKSSEEGSQASALGIKLSRVSLALPSHERLQLQLLPHLLPRERAGGRDNRVQFVPDPWQSRLLDVVDAGGCMPWLHSWSIAVMLENCSCQL